MRYIVTFFFMLTSCFAVELRDVTADMATVDYDMCFADDGSYDSTQTSGGSLSIGYYQLGCQWDRCTEPYADVWTDGRGESR